MNSKELTKTNSFLSVTRALNIVMAVMAILFLSGCSSFDSFRNTHLMQGKVVSVDGNHVVVAIGEMPSGTLAGREFQSKVLKGIPRKAPHNRTAIDYVKTVTATIRIDTIMDGGLAKGTILSGMPSIDDRVQFD